MKRTKRVLILSVKAGAGHLRAAQAVEQAFRERDPEAEIRNVDALEFTNPAFRKAYSEGYESLIRNLPSVWAYLYERMEAQPAKSKLKRLTALFDRLNAKPLRDLVKDYDPDQVVCTHFLPVEVLGRRRRKGKLRAQVSVVITDYDIHTMWIQDGVDRYFVATEDMAYALRMKGVGSAPVYVSGIPILPVFSKEYPARAEMRRELGLRPEAPTVLMSAGGFGLARVDEAVGMLADRLPQAQFITVAGRNRELYTQLLAVARTKGGSIIPFEFVDNMHELMAASDFAVAKCGGLTTSECLAMGLPMVVFNPIPGQEERNATFLLEHGAGVWAHTAAHMMFKVEQLLNNPTRLEAMRAAAREVARPDAAFRIADTVLDSDNRHSHSAEK